MDFTMAAIDLDGTLLHDDMTISGYAREVIQKVEAKGVRIVIATGRMWSSAQRLARELSLGDVPIICYTGAWIIRCESEEVLLKEGVPKEAAEGILALAKRNRWLIQLSHADTLYGEAPFAAEEKYLKYRTGETVYLGEALYHPSDDPTRLILIDPSLEKRKLIRKSIEQEFGDVVDVVFPGDDFVDVHKKNVSKGSALKALCQRWQASPEQIVSFGNTENDVPMFHVSGLSYAVDNADEAAKKAADRRCPSNNEDGVAKVLEELFL